MENKTQWSNNLLDAENYRGWFMGKLKDDTEVSVHFAQDLSGEEQPPFKGFFKDNGSYMAHVDLKEWRKFTPFEDFKHKVARESRYYPYLKKEKGQFNETFLLAAFEAGQTPKDCCNSMTEVT